jgi:hypothetical protein
VNWCNTYSVMMIQYNHFIMDFTLQFCQISKEKIFDYFLFRNLHFFSRKQTIFLIWPQISAGDNIICTHFLKIYSEDGKRFEEKLFILTNCTMFLQIFSKMCCSQKFHGLNYRTFLKGMMCEIKSTDNDYFLYDMTCWVVGLRSYFSSLSGKAFISVRFGK